MNIQAEKYSKNPIMTPRVEEGSFEKAGVYNPAAIVKDGKVHLLYRAGEGYYDSYYSRIGLATSEDGFTFDRYSDNPVMEIDTQRKEEVRGCEDPRVIQLDNGRYFMTYTAYAGRDEQDKPQIALFGAFSDDLMNWEKIGRLLLGREKAGAIIQNYKFKGKYVMYFGEGVIKVAFSEDLKNWEGASDAVLEPRKGYFDDFLVEGGPPPIVTDKGILMIYNSADGAKAYAREKTEWLLYNPGYAIFDKDDPTKLLFRSEKPILEPTEYWEQYGKVNYVVFANGLVYFKNKWLLYYGGADKSIGVAELKLGF